MGCSGCYLLPSGMLVEKRDELQSYIVEHLGDSPTIGVLDETGNLYAG